MRMKVAVLLLFSGLALALGGCSATSLRCGVVEDGSYVELLNVPQDVRSQASSFAQLCGFNQEMANARLSTYREFEAGQEAFYANSVTYSPLQREAP